MQHVVEPGSHADQRVDIIALTTNVVIPLVHSLLDVDLQAIASEVAQLVQQGVSLAYTPCQPS